VKAELSMMCWGLPCELSDINKFRIIKIINKNRYICEKIYSYEND